MTPSGEVVKPSVLQHENTVECLDIGKCIMPLPARGSPRTDSQGKGEGGDSDNVRKAGGDAICKWYARAARRKERVRVEGGGGREREKGTVDSDSRSRPLHNYGPLYGT